MAETVYLLLGSNLGDREKYLTRARVLLAELEGFELLAVSSIYVTEAVDMAPDSPSFMNQVIKGEYYYPAHELLHACEKIESILGRTGKGLKQPRTIDIDILLFGSQIVESDVLTVPHPRLLQRAFALVPLLELDKDIVHSVSGRPLAEYLKPEERNSVVLFKEHVHDN